MRALTGDHFILPRPGQAERAVPRLVPRDREERPRRFPLWAEALRQATWLSIYHMTTDAPVMNARRADAAFAQIEHFPTDCRIFAFASSAEGLTVLAAVRIRTWTAMWRMLVVLSSFCREGAVVLAAVNRDRGASHDATPPTPPGIRVRTTAVRRIKRPPAYP
jgi:hypothetical protein